MQYTQEDNARRYNQLSRLAIAQVTTHGKMSKELAKALTPVQHLHLTRLEIRLANIRG